MRKSLVIFMAAMMMVGGLAFGATTASTAATTLSGVQASAAAVAIAGSGVGLTGIDVGVTTVQQVATLTIGSNDVDGLTISHNSSGNLTLVDDGTTTIAYTIYSDAGGTVALNALSVASDAGLLAGTKTQVVYVKLGGTATYSGTYSEAVTFTVTDNA